MARYKLVKTEREVQSETGKRAEDERPKGVFYSISYHVQLEKGRSENMWVKSWRGRQNEKPEWEKTLRERDTVHEKTENKRDEEGRLCDFSSLRSSLLNRRKKGTICTRHKGHLRSLLRPSRTSLLFVLIVHEQGIVLQDQGLEKISSNSLIVTRNTL